MQYLKELPTHALCQTHEHGGRFAMAFDGVGVTVYLNPQDAKTLKKRLGDYLKHQKALGPLGTQWHNEKEG